MPRSSTLAASRALACCALVFTGQPDYLPRYRYQVRVIVMGGIFTKGMEWLGPVRDRW